MKILSGIPLLLFYVTFMYLTNFLTKAQPPFPFPICNENSNFTLDSVYPRNREAALSSLQNNNSGYGYYNSSVGQGTDTVNAICLCRGDVGLIMCENCLRDSVFRLPIACPNQREAVIYYEYCLLKYSNSSILGNDDMNYTSINNVIIPNKNQFNGFLGPFMNNLRSKAVAGNSSLKFAMDNTNGPPGITLYGMTQCVPSLSEQQCDECLENTINGFSSYGRVGAFILTARCSARYEIYAFAIPSQQSPPLTDKTTSRSRTVIIATILSVSAIVIASVCTFIVLRRKKNVKKKAPNMGIETLTGANHSSWKDSLMLTLGLMEFDYALREPAPPAITSKSTPEAKLLFDKWERSNRMALMLIKNSINPIIRGAIPDSPKAATYLESVEEQFRGTSKAHASTLILKLVTTKYDGMSGILEHIMMMNDMARKLKALDMEISEGFLVHFIMTSLPTSYEAFKINYNTQKDKWMMNELIAMCVQEEERQKVERPDVANLIATNPKKRKTHFSKKDASKVPKSNASSSSSSNNSNGKPFCKFCRKTGHKQKDCPDFKEWLAKRGIPYNPEAGKKPKNA